MPDQLALTRLLNQLFGGSVTSLLHALHISPKYPDAPITNAFALELVVVALLLLFFVLVRASLSIEKPRPIQQIAEIMHGLIGGQADEIIGHGYERYQAFVTVIFLFVLTSNLIGLIPGINAPTESPVVPLGIAFLTWLYFNYHGFRVQGIGGYLKHHAGPIWWIAPLLFPIEIVSNCTRVMSLTIRLYANMFAGGLVTLVFFSLIPIGVPVIFMGLHLAVSFIQAYVFMLLAMIYLSQSVSHDH